MSRYRTTLFAMNNTEYNITMWKSGPPMMVCKYHRNEFRGINDANVREILHYTLDVRTLENPRYDLSGYRAGWRHKLQSKGS